MTRKDYILISEVIRKEVEDYTTSDSDREALNSLAIRLAVRMRADNPQFNKGKFYKACGF